MMNVEIEMSCNDESCDNFEELITTILLECTDKDDLDEFLEGYGYGSEDEDDKCKKCNKLGIFTNIKEVESF